MDSASLYAATVERPFVIAGPCVLESRAHALEVALAVREAAAGLPLTVFFKSSFDKANRTSLENYRGPGLATGIEWLAEVAEKSALPVVTDIHHPEQAEVAGRVAHVLQIPAFLCRQTDLLLAAGRSGRIINIKKGQFMAPWDMQPALDKVRSTGNTAIWLTERGSSFGYNNLVVDFRSLEIMRGMGVPVVFDGTHSVQLPGGLGRSSAGQRAFVPLLCRAAAAAGCRGIFLEVHPDPDKALCDGPNSLQLDRLPLLLRDLVAVWDIRYAC